MDPPPDLKPLPPKRNPPPSTEARMVTPGAVGEFVETKGVASSLLVISLSSSGTSLSVKLPLFVCSVNLLLPIEETTVSISGFCNSCVSKSFITATVLTKRVPSVKVTFTSTSPESVSGKPSLSIP